jgi:hypothetical protein
MKKLIRISTVFWLGLTVQGCRQSDWNGDETIKSALTDLEYVGSVATYSDPIAPHGVSAQQLPQNFLKGRAYIFHQHNRPQTAPVWAMLETRMNAAGIQVLSAPRGAQGLIYSYIGGPFFIIRFQVGSRRGSIQNQLDGAILNNPNLSGS